jgi:hypothetical protein
MVWGGGGQKPLPLNYSGPRVIGKPRRPSCLGDKNTSGDTKQDGESIGIS